MVVRALVGTRMSRLRAGSGGGGAPQLRAVSPNNILPSAAYNEVTTSGTYTNGRFRMPMWIGSGAVSKLRVSLGGFVIGATSVGTFPNAYSIVKLTLEQDGATSMTQTAPITFNGARSITVNPGAVDVQSDDLLPSAMGLANFSVGKYWLRGEISVASGLILPGSDINYTPGYNGGAVSVLIDPAAFVGGAVDGFGVMTLTSGWENQYGFPYLPILLGTFVSGDPHTFCISGDSIVVGTGDTESANISSVGAAQRALFDADGSSNPIGGIKIACAGASASLWGGANAAWPAAYLKYCKYLVDEFGTNDFLNAGSAPTLSEGYSQTLWATWYASGSKAPGSIIKTLLTPRTNSTDNWATTANQSFLNSSWASGGGARQFNDWIGTQIQAAALGYIVPLNSARAGSTADTDPYYQWIVNGTASYATADGVHPSPAVHLLEAIEYRAAYAAMV